MRMRFCTEELNWFARQRLRVEHDLFIVRRKFYGIGWARAKWRSRYRIIGTFPDMPVLPWRSRDLWSHSQSNPETAKDIGRTSGHGAGSVTSNTNDTEVKSDG